MRQESDRLAAAGPPPEPLDLVMLAGLPEPARRWLTHAITPGTPLWRSVELEMHGQLKIGTWRSFTATQVLAPPDGYIWAARASVYGLPVTGYDRLSSGTGQMRWRLLGVLPVVTAAGQDTAVATWQIGAESIDVALRVAPDGRLLDVLVQRWGDADGPFGYVPFGVTYDQERTFAGVTIASVVRAGWWWGTPRQAQGECFRAEITSATHR